MLTALDGVYIGDQFETGGCGSCHGKLGICEKCAPGFAMQIVEENTLDHEVRCKKCPEGCAVCDYDTSKCLDCSENFELVGSRCIPKRSNTAKRCISGSPDGSECYDCPLETQKYSFLERKCVYCPQECSNCHKSGYCSGCNQGFKLDR